MDRRSPRTATTRPTPAPASTPPTRSGPAARTSSSCVSRGAPRGSLRVHLVAVPPALRRRARRRRSAPARRAPRRPAACSRAARRRSSRATPGAPPSVPPRSAPSYGVVQAALRPPHGDGERVRAAGLGRDRARDREVPPRHERLERHRLQLPRRPATARSSRAARAASTRPSSAPTRRATTRSRRASRSSARSAPAASRREAMSATAQLLGWKLSLHGVPMRGRRRRCAPAAASLNRYPSGTPVTVNRICGHRDGDATSCPGDVALRPARRAAHARDRRSPARSWRRGPGDAGRRGRGRPLRPDRRLRRAWSSARAAARPPARPSRCRSAGARARGSRSRAPPPPPTARGRPRSRGGAPARSARARAARARSWRTSPSSPRSAAHAAPAAGRRRGTVLRLSGRVRPADPVRVLVEIKGGDGEWRRVRSSPAASCGGRTSTRRSRLRRPGLYRLTARTAGPGAHVRMRRC